MRRVSCRRSWSVSPTLRDMAGTAAPGGCSPCLSEEREWISTTVWIADSKTPNGIAEVPLTNVAVEAFRDQMSIAGDGPYLFPSDLGACGHHTTFKTTWAATLRRAGVAHFGIYDLRSRRRCVSGAACRLQQHLLAPTCRVGNGSTQAVDG